MSKREIDIDVEIEFHDADEKRLLRAILHYVRRIARVFEPISSTLTFVPPKGESMPQTVHLNDTPGSYLYQEFSGPNGTGIPVPPTGSVQYASDTPAVATIDPNSGQLTYVGAGTATISASDGGNLPSSDLLTVSAAAAQSSTLTFVPPAAPVSAARKV